MNDGCSVDAHNAAAECMPSRLIVLAMSRSLVACRLHNLMTVFMQSIRSSLRAMTFLTQSIPRPYHADLDLVRRSSSSVAAFKSAEAVSLKAEATRVMPSATIGMDGVAWFVVASVCRKVPRGSNQSPRKSNTAMTTRRRSREQ
ncbi:hypothetical protein FH972_022349 [Carpinus fangiana]|uniref:Uncharacterized protein n=1 Tax=Carpinus fangiana TaxID=176857 RepID=A0A5N6KSK0_9ROSI|nr:hypothetical protein FH972_022349 [Carpinus fangiana]